MKKTTVFIVGCLLVVGSAVAQTINGIPVTKVYNNFTGQPDYVTVIDTQNYHSPTLYIPVTINDSAGTVLTIQNNGWLDTNGSYGSVYGLQAAYWGSVGQSTPTWVPSIVYTDGTNDLGLGQNLFAFPGAPVGNFFMGSQAGANCLNCQENAAAGYLAATGLLNGSFNAAWSPLFMNDAAFSDPYGCSALGAGASLGIDSVISTRTCIGAFCQDIADHSIVLGSVFGTNQSIYNSYIGGTIPWLMRIGIGTTNPAIQSGVEIGNEGGQGDSQLLLDAGVPLVVTSSANIKAGLAFNGNQGTNGQFALSLGKNVADTWVTLNSTNSYISASTATQGGSFVGDSTGLSAAITPGTSISSVTVVVSGGGYASGSVGAICDVTLTRQIGAAGITILSPQPLATTTDMVLGVNGVGNLGFVFQDLPATTQNVKYTVNFRASGTTPTCTFCNNGSVNMRCNIVLNAFPY